jgi:hypothetical protein
MHRAKKFTASTGQSENARKAEVPKDDGWSESRMARTGGGTAATRERAGAAKEGSFLHRFLAVFSRKMAKNGEKEAKIEGFLLLLN